MRRRVAGLAPAVLFPGAARVPDDPAEALADKIAHLEQLGEQVVALDREGRGEREIVHALLGPAMWIERMTLGHFSRRNLVRSYLGRNADPSDVRWTA